MTVALIVLGGIFTAYIFLGRNLTRLAYTQEQEVKSRHVLRQFTSDVSAAVSFMSTTSSNLTFTVPAALTNYSCSTTSGNATVTCVGPTQASPNSISALQSNVSHWGTPMSAWGAGPSVWGTGTLTVTNCATTLGSPTVTCASAAGTAGMQVGVAVAGPGIPTNAVVNAIPSLTTFVLSANATATNTGATVTTVVKCIPDNAVVNSITVNSSGGNTTASFVMSANAIATTTGATLYTADAISYNYDTGNATLTRTDFDINSTSTQLSYIDPTATSPSNGFTYYNTSDAAVTSAASLKKVQLSFTSKSGMAAIGTQSVYVTISPHVAVRNKSVSR